MCLYVVCSIIYRDNRFNFSEIAHQFLFFFCCCREFYRIVISEEISRYLWLCVYFVRVWVAIATWKRNARYFFLCSHSQNWIEKRRYIRKKKRWKYHSYRVIFLTYKRKNNKKKKRTKNNYDRVESQESTATLLNYNNFCTFLFCKWYIDFIWQCVFVCCLNYWLHSMSWFLPMAMEMNPSHFYVNRHSWLWLYKRIHIAPRNKTENKILDEKMLITMLTMVVFFLSIQDTYIGAEELTALRT